MRKPSLHIIYSAVLSFFSGIGSFRIYAALALQIALCWLTTPLIAQSDLEVRRCLAVESRRPIVNIFVDESDNKWVSNGRELFQVQSLEVATPVVLKAGEQSLLNLPGGNYDLRWPEAALNALLGTDYGFITAAFYHKNRQELWIGTSQGGAFQINATGDLKLVNTYTNKNSKLRSNRINAIYINDSGDVWMGTDEGMLVGKGGRWSLEEKLFRFERIAAHGSTLWVLGDDFIWKINNRGTWVPVDVDERQLEGAVRDIAVDIEGHLWVASEIITRFDPETQAYQKFGPIEYYTSQYATALAIDQEDAIWVGTEDKGVYLIGKASSMIVNCLIARELDCNSTNNDAALRVQADGGEAPYTYAWNNGGSGSTLQNLGPGEYIVTVTDSKGKSKIAQAVIPDTRFTVEVQALQEESISGATDGSASVIVAGAPSAFQFSWSNGETTQTALQLPAGTHTVTVTDAKGCKAIGSVSIAQGAAPLGIAIEQLRSIPCAGDSNAALKVQISGGKAPFNYTWSNPKLTGAEPTDIPPGTYQLQVTDAAGNSESAIIAIKAPDALQATIRVDASATTDNADGKATANANGGTGNFNYRWSNGETTQSATRLAPGEHTVTITDVNGCTTTAAVTITEDILPLSVSISETQPIRCAGNSEAALSVQVAGGKGPFRFQWNDSNLSGQEVSNLPTGNYSITVTDAAGNNQVANIAIKAPDALQATIRVDASATTDNADGKATANANGGTGNFNYRWSNGETTQSATQLAPGEHTVTITDANGCTTTATTTITEDILPLSVSISETQPIRCAGSSEAALSVQVAGGKGPFRFQWSESNLSGQEVSNLPQGNYSITVTDAAGSNQVANIAIKAPDALQATIRVDASATTDNADGKATANANGGTGNFNYRWSNGETTQSATRLAPGEHTVTITDVNGCTTTAAVTITEDILPLSVSISETQPIRCAGNSEAALSVQVAGGKGPFRFQWNDSNLSGQEVSNLPQGNYSITVTDALGTSTNATINISEPAALSVAISKTRGATTETTKDGKATAEVAGGSAPHRYQWTSGESNADARQLPMGIQMVTVTDANGCTATASTEVTRRILPDLTVEMLKSGEAIRMEQLQFDADSTNINEPSKPVLDELYDFLTDNPAIVVEIGGHTNGLPPADYCDRISTARAQAVADYLVERGIDKKRLYAKGYGKRQLIASDDTPEGRRRNQRVEIRILDLDD